MYKEISTFAAYHNVTLVAVSKTKPVEDIKNIYNQGQRHFGENKVQELLSKQEVLPNDVKWHLIGTLQRNKVKYIAPFVHLIHSCESIDLLDTIIKEGNKIDRKLSILLQFHIASEETKHGFEESEIDTILDYFKASERFVNVCGVMGMASFTDDQSIVKQEFTNLQNIFTRVHESKVFDPSIFKEISMGMSGDYKLAVDCGSTMIRVGSAIFGGR